MTNGAGPLDFAGIGAALVAAGFCGGLIVGRRRRRVRRHHRDHAQGLPIQGEFSAPPEQHFRPSHLAEYVALEHGIREAYIDEKAGEVDSSLSMIEVQHLEEVAAAQDKINQGLARESRK